MDIHRTTNANRLLWAGFFAIFAAGVGFAVRARVLSYWAADYGFTMGELGDIAGGGLVGFGVIILIGSLIADRLGYGKLMGFAVVMHLVSAALQLCTDPIYQAFGRDGVYWSLYVAMFLFAIGNGTCEVVVNPVVAALFPDNKTHYLNILHAGWPGGLVAGNIVSYFMNGGSIGDWVPLGNVHWLIQMSMFLIPVAIYGFMVLGQEFPKSEAGQAGVSFGAMLLTLASPLFVLLLVIHALVGYVELGVDSWYVQINGRILSDLNTAVLLMLYSVALMFTLRFFGGPLERRLSPLGLLCAGGVLAALGLSLMSRAEGLLLCFLAATVYAVGKTFWWPTMLAVVSERFPRGGAIAIGTVGGVGMLSAGFLGGPGIGFEQDFYTAERLQEQRSAAYERYKADKDKTFLFVLHAQGLDGAKINVLELSTTKDKIFNQINDANTTAAKKADLQKDLKETNEKLETALKNEKVDKWWETAKADRSMDKPPVEESIIYGGRMALLLTAAVPATMAILYLVLILYFRAKGGYTKELVGTKPGVPPAAWQ